MKYIVLNLETLKKEIWTQEELLEEINRDHSEEWSKYTAQDIFEGWNEWCEGEFYCLIGYVKED